MLAKKREQQREEKNASATTRQKKGDECEEEVRNCEKREREGKE